jgi:hypothetical protein
VLPVQRFIELHPPHMYSLPSETICYNFLASRVPDPIHAPMRHPQPLSVRVSLAMTSLLMMGGLTEATRPLQYDDNFAEEVCAIINWRRLEGENGSMGMGWTSGAPTRGSCHAHRTLTSRFSPMPLRTHPSALLLPYASVFAASYSACPESPFGWERQYLRLRPAQLGSPFFFLEPRAPRREFESYFRRRPLPRPAFGLHDMRPDDTA